MTGCTWYDEGQRNPSAKLCQIRQLDITKLWLSQPPAPETSEVLCQCQAGSFAKFIQNILQTPSQHTPNPYSSYANLNYLKFKHWHIQKHFSLRFQVGTGFSPGRNISTNPTNTQVSHTPVSPCSSSWSPVSPSSLLKTKSATST